MFHMLADNFLYLGNHGVSLWPGIESLPPDCVISPCLYKSDVKYTFSRREMCTSNMCCMFMYPQYQCTNSN